MGRFSEPGAHWLISKNGWPSSSEDPLVSTPTPCQPGRPLCLAFTWVPGIWTQVLGLERQSTFPTEPSLQPLDLLFNVCVYNAHSVYIQSTRYVLQFVEFNLRWCPWGNMVVKTPRRVWGRDPGLCLWVSHSFPRESRRVPQQGRKSSQVLSDWKCDFEVPEATAETEYGSNVMLKWGHDRRLGKKQTTTSLSTGSQSWQEAGGWELLSISLLALSIPALSILTPATLGNSDMVWSSRV